MDCLLLNPEFWNAFFPNFASTILGLLFGIPLALWTNRKIINYQDKKKSNENEQRLVSALEIIHQTMTENLARLEKTTIALNNWNVQFDTLLDISAWDAVKDDISHYLHDPNLKKRVAYHFSRLTTMTKLNSMYLDFSAGISSALDGMTQTRSALKSNLLQTIIFLQKDIIEILPLIEKRVWR